MSDAPWPPHRLDEAPDGGLPVPGRERFQLLRAGILNLWHYDEQELRFHDGRLILRGENGAGKSKALELLLPFLLDADLSPQRLDPFGGTSRTMEWNLLLDGRHDARIGYVWLELGRRLPDGGDGGATAGGEETEHWTLGCGLRASQRTRRVDSWYFLTRRRVGLDLDLHAHRVPLLKDQLRLQIGDAGWVFDAGRDYREKLDAQLFGLGEDRFATLRHLLLQLRRPHLSERLDPQTLSETLKESLPPLDPFLIGQLSEAFERLDNDQKELARVESAAAGVAAFLDLYREYGQGMSRSRAADVRQADSRYHRTAAEVREAEEEHGRQDARLQELDGREREVESGMEEARGRLRAYEQSDAMRSAEALRARRESADLQGRRAAQAREDAELESRRAAALGRELESAETEARAAEEEREERAAAAREAARSAGLEAVHGAALEALPFQPGAALGTVRAAVRARGEGIVELRRLAAEHGRARDREDLARERLHEADAQSRSAAERGHAARGELERRCAALDQALLDWWQGLGELPLEAPAFEVLRGRVLQIAAESGDETAGGPEGLGLAAGVEAAARAHRDALVRRRAALEGERGEVEAESRGVAAERGRVAAARELGPEPPRTRAAERQGRPGAPLYLLCELAPSLSPEEGAGLEAALEAGGLLDAWITPGGALLDPGTLDTCLVPEVPEAAGGGRLAGRTLADVLVAAPGHGVTAAEVEAVLRSIALPEGGGWNLAAAVGPDGAFRLGPLRGAWAKPVAEHLGAGAREAARQRRLAELEARLGELAVAAAALAEREAELGARLDRLQAEVDGLPSAAPLAAAWHQALAAARDEARRRAELAAAGAALAALRAAREELERRLGARARELDLAAHLQDLDGYRDRLRHLEGAFEALVRAAGLAVRAEERRGAAHRRLAEAAERQAELTERARDAAAAAAAARAEADELEATVGAEAREIVELHRAETGRLRELEQRRRALAEEVRAAAEQRARFRERLELRRAELEERDAERARAVTRLGTVIDAGWLPLVLPGSPDVEPEAPAGEAAPASEAPSWSLTRALDLAREIERASRKVELTQEAADRRARRLWERFQILAADLGADYQPRLDQDDDLLLVRVGFNGRDHDVPGLLAALREGIEVRRALLADHERELLRRFLLGEVGDHLRHRLREAQALVAEMNGLLERCRTASGMALRLAWDPLQESAPEVREAVSLLSRDYALLQDAERRRLEAFFQARISEARSRWEAVPWRDHLMAALDYRSWYRFRILRRTGAAREWLELTRRGHGAASGGEKAVALHLPLFAAAAAHYRSARPTAPRLILLDEAFAGIDQGMRGRCMGLLVALDLDFLMTSHDEWGCYEELPGVATYHLYRDPTMEGVAAVRFVWTGTPPAEAGG